MLRTVSSVPATVGGVHNYARWVAESCQPGLPVLNVGAGRSRSGALRPVLRREPYLVGIDPDASIHDNRTLDERHQSTMQNFAADNEGRFAVVFSVYVLEHVSDPPAFLDACARVLRPGGVLFGLTMNMYQYFGMITWATTRMGVAEPLLRKMKGREVVERYHFPTEYRLNSVGRLTRSLDRAGFSSVDFRCFDKSRAYAWYLPNAMSGWPPLYTRMVYAAGAPRLMGHLTFRAVLGDGRS